MILLFEISAGQFTYNCTERRVINNETVELMRQLKRREFHVSERVYVLKEREIFQS